MNTFKNYFENLAREYRGGKEIEKLLACLPVKNKADQTILHLLFRLWLRLAVGQAMQLCVNRYLLLLIGKNGGEGKTYFINWLCPPDLRQHFFQISPVESSAYQLPYQTVSEKFIINFEEIPFNPKRSGLFKQRIMQSNFKSVSVYSPKAKNYQTFNRTASFTCSTNFPFLIKNLPELQDMIIPFEIEDKINRDYVNIDREQLWGQIANEFLEDKKDYDKEDGEIYRAICWNLNEKYRLETMRHVSEVIEEMNENHATC